jgi:alpha-ketoglutarate-dependent taurine dioxygenase
MEIRSIQNGVAVEVTGVDITALNKSNDYNFIRDALHKHLVVVIKKQSTNPWEYTRFIENIGRVANYDQFAFTVDAERYPLDRVVPTNQWKTDTWNYPVQRVTGKKKDGKFTGIFGTGKLDWHANLNGLDRADGVALQGWEYCENTSTSFLNTNLAYNELDVKMLDKIKNLYCEYEYSPEVWAEGLHEDQLRQMKQNATKYKMWLIQENLKGVKGLYFYTNNRCKLICSDQNLYDEIHKHLFQDKYIYQHWWEPGDIVLMDQLLTLHKRDQNDPEILSNRVLHRITFRISNVNNFIALRNQC